jgi:hypothetical protein
MMAGKDGLSVLSIVGGEEITYDHNGTWSTGAHLQPDHRAPSGRLLDSHQYPTSLRVGSSRESLIAPVSLSTALHPKDGCYILGSGIGNGIIDTLSRSASLPGYTNFLTTLQRRQLPAIPFADVSNEVAESDALYFFPIHSSLTLLHLAFRQMMIAATVNCPFMTTPEGWYEALRSQQVSESILWIPLPFLRVYTLCSSRAIG